jgi:hypothetical protein
MPFKEDVQYDHSALEGPAVQSMLKNAVQAGSGKYGEPNIEILPVAPPTTLPANLPFRHPA